MAAKILLREAHSSSALIVICAVAWWGGADLSTLLVSSWFTGIGHKRSKQQY